MKHVTKKVLLAISIMLGSFAPTKGATLLFLAPSVAGSYGTYKTLTDQPGVFGNTFAQSCTKFYDAMDHEANPEHPRTIIRAFFINFGKHFKSHEKLAMIGSAGAVLGDFRNSEFL